MDRLKLFASVQCALLDKVTPNLRSVDLVLDDYFELVFFYDQTPSKQEEILTNMAYTELISNFHAPEYKIRCNIQVVPYPEKILGDGLTVFSRYEGV
jgi:hypothetical protein